MPSAAGNAMVSNEERFECRISFVLDDPGPTWVDDDLRMADSLLDTGVLGGEFSVASCEPKVRSVC